MNIKSMIKCFCAMVAFVVVAALSGCNELPSEAAIETTAKLAGSAAGIAVSNLNIDGNLKSEIIDTIDNVAKIVPGTNDTFSTAWAPLYTKRADELVVSKKLTQAQADLLKKAMSVVCSGLDYVFEVKHPKAKTYQDLVSAAVRGFVAGVKLTVRTNTEVAGAVPEYDADLLAILMQKVQTK